MRPHQKYSVEVLARLLSCAAAGSAEHVAIQRELRHREIQLKQDRSQFIPFTGSEWEQIKRRWCLRNPRRPTGTTPEPIIPISASETGSKGKRPSILGPLLAISGLTQLP